MTTHADPDLVPRGIERVPVGERTPASVPRPPFILAVDDSPDMRAMLREVLELAGYEVATAGSSAQALTVMSDRVPDVLITDLIMPGMSGFSLRSHMLRRPDLAPVPVIVLSAYWARPRETLDAVAVLRKPIDLDRFLETVRAALDRRAPA